MVSLIFFQVTLVCNSQYLVKMVTEYRACMASLASFDYIWLITLMHLNSGYRTKIRPQPNPILLKTDDGSLSRDKTGQPASVGLFCSRAPHRPNPIAISAVRIISVNETEGRIEVDGLDLLNGNIYHISYSH